MRRPPAPVCWQSAGPWGGGFGAVLGLGGPVRVCPMVEFTPARVRPPAGPPPLMHVWRSFGASPQPPSPRAPPGAFFGAFLAHLCGAVRGRAGPCGAVRGRAGPCALVRGHAGPCEAVCARAASCGTVRRLGGSRGAPFPNRCPFQTSAHSHSKHGRKI